MQQGYRSRGSSQPQKLRFPRFSRPHSFVYSEHQPKECAGSRKEKERKETKKNKKKGKERTKGVRRQQKGKGKKRNEEEQEKRERKKAGKVQG